MILTIPNVLTLLRLLSLPIVIALFRGQHFLGAAALFAAAMIADIIDGWAARRLNQQSTLGLYLDPVADKVIILALFYELARAALIPWTVAHLFLARELLHSAVRDVAAVSGTVVGANGMGKTKAALQTIVITLWLALPALQGRISAAAYDGVDLALGIATGAVLAVSWGFFVVFVAWNRKLFRATRDA
jgi:CDP-diacylglycerol--glycerol-3-phosphate 3-phosphatidyltransferase